MTDDERISRGRQATTELKLTEDAFRGVEAHLLEKLLETSPDQPDRVLEIHRAVQNLALVRKALLLMVTDGQYAAAAVAASGLLGPR